jgi:hypothetical protein
MKRFTSFIVSACFFSFIFDAAAASQVQSVRTTPQLEAAPAVARDVSPGVTAGETQTIVTGWSLKKNLLDKEVYNDKKESLGAIEDIIVTPKDSMPFAILGVGGFLGVNERRIAIHLQDLQVRDDRFELPGATKDALKAMPPFVYSH